MMVGTMISSTSPLVLTHVVVHLGRCCWYLPSVDLNNNSLGGSIIIIIIQLHPIPSYINNNNAGALLL